MNNDCEREISRLRMEIGRLEEEVDELKECVKSLKKIISNIMTVAVKLMNEFNKVVSRNGVPRGRYIYCMGGFRSMKYVVSKIAEMVDGVRC